VIVLLVIFVADVDDMYSYVLFVGLFLHNGCSGIEKCQYSNLFIRKIKQQHSLGKMDISPTNSFPVHSRCCSPNYSDAMRVNLLSRKYIWSLFFALDTPA